MGLENHVAGLDEERRVGPFLGVGEQSMCGEFDVDGGMGLVRGDLVDGSEHGWVDGASVVEKRADDLLQTLFAFWSEQRTGVNRSLLLLDQSVLWRRVDHGRVGAGEVLGAKAIQSILDVLGHGELHGVGVAVVGDDDAEVLGACPIRGDGVELFQCGDQVVGVLASFVLHAEVVHDERKRDGARLVNEETARVWALVVAVLRQVGNESILCELSRVWQSVHAFADFDQNFTVDSEARKIVALLDVFGNLLEVDVHVDGRVHGRAEVVVLDVDRHPVGIFGDDGVEKKLDCGERGGERGAVLVVLDAIAADSATNTVVELAVFHLQFHLRVVVRG